MNRVLTISLSAVCLVGIAVLGTSGRIANAQLSGSVPAYVRLQATTPGTAQTGHSNVTGTAIAAEFKGGGSGLTGVNADLFDGLDSTSFLQSIPNPLSLTASQSGGIIVKGTNTSTGANSIGVAGDATGNGTSSTGVRGTSASPTGRGVSGLSTSVSGVAIAGYFENSSPAGFGVFSKSKGLYGVFGWSELLSGTGYGGFFQADSTTGIAVRGVATSGNPGAVGGSFSTPAGKGVFGEATDTTGTTYGGYFESKSDSGRGVYGLASSAAPNTAYGVVGQNMGTGGYGVYALGDLGASGVKTFRIDHPLDPANKYLLHYSSESPFPQNFYSGNSTTDAQGYAWVQLPDYFSQINTNFKYQLTVVDTSDSADFVWAKVVKKVAGNRFRIRSNKPGIEVSWRIEADRNDLRIQSRRPQDVINKPLSERGTYQQPELYGMPQKQGIDSSK